MRPYTDLKLQETLKIIKSNTNIKDALIRYLEHYITQRMNSVLQTKDNVDLYESRGVVKFLESFKKEIELG